MPEDCSRRQCLPCLKTAPVDGLGPEDRSCRRSLAPARRTSSHLVLRLRGGMDYNILGQRCRTSTRKTSPTRCGPGPSLAYTARTCTTRTGNFARQRPRQMRFLRLLSRAPESLHALLRKHRTIAWFLGENRHTALDLCSIHSIFVSRMIPSRLHLGLAFLLMMRLSKCWVDVQAQKLSHLLKSHCLTGTFFAYRIVDFSSFVF